MVGCVTILVYEDCGTPGRHRWKTPVQHEGRSPWSGPGRRISISVVMGAPVFVRHAFASLTTIQLTVVSITARDYLATGVQVGVKRDLGLADLVESPENSLQSLEYASTAALKRDKAIF